nr:hypothetical protein Ccrd_004710 [Ipomoea batatas]
MLASSLSLSVSIPAFENILGLYITTASIALNCWNKWIPTPVNRMWRTFGVGRRNKSFHTPFPPPDSFLTSTTSSWQSSGIPAASLIPASLRRDSSMESEVFSRTFFAWPSFPCITSQRVDKNLRERSEEATDRLRRHLGGVHRSNHEGVSDADSGDEAAHHEESVVGGEPHQQRSDEEHAPRNHDGVPPPYQVRRPPRHGGADERVDVDCSDQELHLHVGDFQILLDVNRRATHHSRICT